MEEFKEDIIYILLVFINFLFIFNIMKYVYVILDFNYLISFAYVLISVLIFIILKYAARKMYIKILFLSAMIISLVYYIFYNKVWIINRLAFDFNIINSNISNSMAISFNNFYIILIIIIPLVVILLLLYSRGLYTSVLFFTLSFMIFLWYAGFTEQVIENLFRYTFLNVFTLVIINYIKNRKIFRKKDVRIRTSILGILIYGIIIAIICSSIIKLLPKEYYGKLNSDSYSYFQNKFQKSAKKPTVSEKYNISYSGYNDSSSSLGGPIREDNSIALEVYGGNFLYLRGNVKDYYTGNSWNSITNTYRNDNMNLAKSKLKNSSIASVRIKPIGLITSTVFAPAGSFEVKNDDKQVFVDSYGCFLREKPYDTEYTVFYYDELKMVDDYNNTTLRASVFGSVIETNYIQVPDTVPQEVFDLVYDIIKKNNAVSNYDKVICLKKYLEQNYKYTLNTKEPVKGEDFVYNFLFKEKQGYCTYFASALAIMCRIAKVPAVYVEGFKQSGSPIVTNNMAHAWVEVNLTNDDMWLIADPAPTAYQDNEDINNPETEGDINIPGKNKPNHKDINEDIEKADFGETDSISKNTIVKLIIIFILLILMFVRILFILIRRKIILNSKSVIPLMIYSIKRLKSLGIKKGETEGFLEFSERIKDAKLRHNMILLSNCYNKEAYGNRKSETDKKEIYKYIEGKIREERGSVKYYLEKFIK